ncbi:MAG: hypothetical protein AAF943_02300 [Pseudomonadota bacterium]
MAKKSKTKARKERQAAARAVVETPTRRDMMRRIGLGGLVLAGAGGATYAGIDMYRDYMVEHDLSRLGQGKPAVVQVHDPQCGTCLALQNETRRAMRQFGECDVIYVVADIRQPEGQVFARRHNVPHVTLVLMDGRGEVTQVLSGFRERADLEPILKAHFEAHGQRSGALS